MEIRVYKKLIVRGPIKTPTGPRREIPPNTAKSIRSGEIFIFFPTIYGERKLSTIPTTMPAQIIRPRRCR